MGKGPPISRRGASRRGAGPARGLGGVLCLILSTSAALAQPARAARDDDPPPSAQQAEPIIPDDELDAALPSLEETPTATPPAGDAPSEPTLDPAPDIDAGIDAPLQPLAGFDVEPFDESRYTEAGEGEGALVRYRYAVDGLDNIDGEAKVRPISGDAIYDRFHDLSALEKGDGKAANGAMIEARMREDQQLLTDILSGEGFFDSVVDATVELPERGSGDPVTARLSVAPGPRYRLGEIRFDAPALDPPDLIAKAFIPKPGEPIVATRILAAEANIQVSLPEHGYPFVTVGQRDILLDPQTRTGDYTLPVDPGPRSRFGDIRIAGDKPVFDPAHVATIARFRKGELYDSRMVDDLRRALVATGLLASVAVEPKRTGEAAGEGTEYAAISVAQEAGPPRTLSGQAGYATGQGIKLEGSWTHHNLFPPEGALILSGTAGTQEQGLGATFRRSNAGRRDRTVVLGVDATRSNFDAFEALTGRIAGHVSIDSTPIWQKRISYNYGFELLASSERDYDFDAGQSRRRLYYVAALPGQITFDTSNSLLDPTHGFRLTATLSPEASLGSGSQVYLRSIVQGTAYYPVADSFVLAGRLRMGAISGARRTLIAPSRRFYAGGGGSVRGFGYQEVGPKDPDARPIGGRSLVEASGEVRYRFGSYGIVAFVDAGQVYTSELPRFTDWRVGVGLGGRFYTNFGPMRLDVAMPLNRQKGESRFSVYVSIGQAF